MSEDSQPVPHPDIPTSQDVSPDIPTSQDVSPDIPTSQDVSLAKAARLSDRVTGHLADQARVTAQGAKARRVKSTDGQPGVTDLTPLRELLSELVEEARKVRARERIAQALRQAADAIDPPGN